MSAPLSLRVAMVWSQTLHAEHLLHTPRRVALGYGADALFPLPEAEARGGDLTLLTPSEHSYTLHLPTAASGAVWLTGRAATSRSYAATARASSSAATTTA